MITRTVSAVLSTTMNPTTSKRTCRVTSLALLTRMQKLLQSIPMMLGVFALITSDNSNVGIANVNMFRYRGYYYDFEIGMYYLWSRYFDPSIGRFINSDNPDIFVLYSVIENNLYTYCLNNPINNRDEKGRLATWIVKKIVSVILEFCWSYSTISIRCFFKCLQ